jgi:protein O-GlcNAc transferase
MNPSQTARSEQRDASHTTATFQRAVSLHQQGEKLLASELCQEVLRADSLHFGALHLQGLIAVQNGDVERGMELINRSLAIQPHQPAAHSNMGNALLDLKQPERALACFNRALELHPAYPVAWYNRGNALRDLGRLQEALESYDRALSLRPNYALALTNRGNVLIQLNRIEEALVAFDRALELAPDFAEALKNRAGALLTLERTQECLQAYERLLQLTPGDADAHYCYGYALLKLQQYEAALGCFDQAIGLRPTFAEAHNNRGVALRELHRRLEALTSLDRALQLDPVSVEALNNRGNTLMELKRSGEALASYSKALSLKPDHPDALRNQAAVLQKLGRYDEAAASYRRVAELAPDYDYVTGVAFDCSLQRCDWREYGDATARILRDLEAGRRSDLPFPFLAVSHAARAQLECARIYAASCMQRPEPALCAGGYGHQRIRVAYVSGDLRDHVVAYLMSGVFERHDRERFETIAISLQPPEDSGMGRRLQAAFGRFIDVSGMGDREVSTLLHQLEVDIAVDLMGYTEGHRTAIFAPRPAPVQVNYLGFPGTMGSGVMDYILADEFVIPPASRQHYAEQVVYLPECFQANDDQRVMGAAPTRAQVGLPQRGVVFCCFNSSYKLNPPMFDIWCRLLRSVPDSVLWLVGDGAVHANLQREAERRGVAADRLIMAGRLPYAQHLGRLTLADLFLDTLPFNAGATASDALWVGVPVLTCLGEAFAGRMAGSLLRALGLPELITQSLEEYEERALQLARAPERLAALKQTLVAQRHSAPPFNTARFCRHLEAAYVRMWERAERGDAPAAFAIEALPA